MIDVLRKRLARWRGKRLSFGGRIFLLKSVLSSIPLYYLSFFRLPRKVLKIIIGLQRSFKPASFFALCLFCSGWYWLYGWLGFHIVLPNDNAEHYLMHRGLFRGKKLKKFRSLFWHTTVWTLWPQRNEFIFKQPFDFLSIAELIKQRSWHWFKAENDNLDYSYTDWHFCPMGCLS